MEMFERAFAMFAPFARREAQGNESDKAAAPQGGEIDDLKRQLTEMQKRLDRLTTTDPKEGYRLSGAKRDILQPGCRPA
jgi:hypothetical protein